MQIINTIIAKPNKTIQLATGNSVVDALMAHQTPSMELRPDMERQSDTSGIQRCHQLLPSSQPAELAQRSYLDGLQQEPAGVVSEAFVNWQMSFTDEPRHRVLWPLAVKLSSGKSSGMGVKHDPTGFRANIGDQFTSQIAFGTRSTATTKRHAYQGSYPTYSTFI